MKIIKKHNPKFHIADHLYRILSISGLGSGKTIFFIKFDLSLT